MVGLLRVAVLFALVMGGCAVCAPARAGVLIQNPTTLECVGLQPTMTLNGVYSVRCAPNGLSDWTINNGLISSNVYQVGSSGSAQAMCLEVPGGVPGDAVELDTCHPTVSAQRWTIDRGHLVNAFKNECLSRVQGLNQLITEEDCIFSGAGAKAQTWVLD
jgi:hypothetical protein